MIKFTKEYVDDRFREVYRVHERLQTEHSKLGRRVNSIVRVFEILGGAVVLTLSVLGIISLVGCARVGVEDSTHEVKVSGGTENVIRLEIGSCDSIKNEQKKVKCIEAMIDLMAMFADKGNEDGP